MNLIQKSLDEALAVIGIRHSPSAIAGKRNWFAPNGEFLGAYDAHEGWEKLKGAVEQAGA